MEMASSSTDGSYSMYFSARARPFRSQLLNYSTVTNVWQWWQYSLIRKCPISKQWKDLESFHPVYKHPLQPAFRRLRHYKYNNFYTSSRHCAGFPPGILGPNHRRWAVLHWAWSSTKINLSVNHIIIMVLGHLVALGIRIRQDGELLKIPALSEWQVRRSRHLADYITDHRTVFPRFFLGFD